jgi:hypothetical protein
MTAYVTDRLATTPGLNLKNSSEVIHEEQRGLSFV